MNEEYEAMPDINSLDQFADVEEIDEQASVTDTPPPPSAGHYGLKLKLAEGASKEKAILEDVFPAKNVQTFTVQGVKQLMIVLDLQLLDAEGNEIGRSKREWASTMVGRAVKTSMVDTLLAKLGIRSQGMSNGQKVKALYDAVAGGRDTLPKGVEIDWELVETEGHMKANREGVEKKVYDTFLRGMTRFPAVQVGNQTVYKPLEEDPATGTPAVTRWAVKKFC